MPPKATAAKKQQSISSFFAKKPAKDSSTSPAGTAPITTLPTRESNIAQPNIHDEESDEDILPARRRVVSNKRPLEEDVDAANGGKEPSTKRAKSNNEGEDESMFFPESSLHRDEIEARVPENKKKDSATSRTERYVYNPSQAIPDPSTIEEEDEEVRAEKELLHRKFVKKLSHPDSIARIQRRNWQITEETEKLDNEDGEDAEEEDEAPAPKAKKKGSKTGKLTPGELQMLEIKRKHLDAILIIEMGYKFKFFGEDARVAAKALGIVCIPGKLRYDEHPSEAHLDRFASASFPVHRLQVHAKRLVLAGHKVGIVRQLETAALKKAGDNRNTPFVRKLTNLYTKGTYVDDIEGLDTLPDAPSAGAPSSGYLLCITETKAKGWGTDEKVDVGILAVQPATGDIIYDTFEDGFMRSEIETRLLHISPCELLIVGELTKASDKLVQHLSGSKANVFGDSVRVERVDKPKTMAAQAYSHVTQFYAGKVESRGNTEGERATDLLEKVLKLAEPITICLSAMITHMTEYGLEHVFDLTKYFQSFSARSHMLINGNTLESLEIFRNQTDHSERGSLFWAVNKTKTRFGERLLRKWVGQPLLDQERLEERLSAVEELTEGEPSSNLEKLKTLLTKIKSDLERSLLRIYYGKCSRPELLTVLQALQHISNEFSHIQSPSDTGFNSLLISSAIASLPTIGDIVISYLDQINPEAARTDDKYAFFREEAESEDISTYKLAIASCEADLDQHRPEAAAKIKKKTVTYVTSSAIEYLIEVPNTDLKNVPASWTKISGTKKLSRFHTPEVLKMTKQLAQYKESLASACDSAFKTLLTELSSHYQPLRDTISSLATLDCLLSLSATASQPGYNKPTILTPTTDCPSTLEISDARHPMIEHLLPPTETYIPNSTTLSSTHTRALLITGPNMGGKSSFVRTIALIILLAQLGSYVPASSLRLTPFDGIHTRMGASDNLFTGSSTFHHELVETSRILKTATPRSLVVLDELGRGTSTHDGVAIAEAVAEFVLRDVGCLMLFITHYQSLAGLVRGFRDGEVKNVFMKFESERMASAVSGTSASAGGSDGDGREDEGPEEITFLYEVGEGVAHRSYGLNVARLAKIPKKVLEVAGTKSRELEEEVRQKKMNGLANLFKDLVLLPKSNASSEAVVTQQLDQLVTGIEQL